MNLQLAVFSFRCFLRNFLHFINKPANTINWGILEKPSMLITNIMGNFPHYVIFPNSSSCLHSMIFNSVFHTYLYSNLLTRKYILVMSMFFPKSYFFPHGMWLLKKLLKRNLNIYSWFQCNFPKYWIENHVFKPCQIEEAHNL